MPPLPGMMIWTDSFLADVATLTTEEIGAHMMLRVAAWRAKDGRLPDDDRHLARVCRASPRVWARLRPVLAKLWVVDGGFWSNEALDHERKRATAVSQTRSTAAHAKHRKTKETGDAYAPRLHMHLDIEEDKKKNLDSCTAETPTPREAETEPETVVEPGPPSPTAPAPAEGKTKASPEPRGTRLPATGWKLTPEMAQHARDKGLTDDEIRIEALRFRDHWLGVPGARGRKADWPATWRNWCLKAIERRPARPSGQQPRAAPIDPRLASRIAESKARNDAISSAEAAGLNPLDEAFDRHVGALMMEWYNNEQRRSA